MVKKFKDCESKITHGSLKETEKELIRFLNSRENYPLHVIPILVKHLVECEGEIMHIFGCESCKENLDWVVKNFGTSCER